MFEVDPSVHDGIVLRVRGDGNRYKLRLRTSDGSFEKGFIYQAPFDTVKGQWMDIKLPFDYFYNNRQTVVNYAPEDTIKARGKRLFDTGFVYSKFDFNERLNSKFLTESFQLDVESIRLYRDVRPAFVLISSAGTERVNRLTAAERMRDIPIVQLNPQVKRLI